MTITYSACYSSVNTSTTHLQKQPRQQTIVRFPQLMPSLRMLQPHVLRPPRSVPMGKADQDDWTFQ